MKPVLSISLLALSVSIGFVSCNTDDEFIIVPQEYIVGKWETTQVGNWPNMLPPQIATGYTEFTSDSLVRFYDYEQKKYTSQSVYWLTDSLLIEAYWRSDGKQVLFKREYQFKKNWLRLEIIEATSILSTEILKKIE